MTREERTGTGLDQRIQELILHLQQAGIAALDADPDDEPTGCAEIDAWARHASCLGGPDALVEVSFSDAQTADDLDLAEVFVASDVDPTSLRPLLFVQAGEHPPLGTYAELRPIAARMWRIEADPYGAEVIASSFTAWLSDTLGVATLDHVEAPAEAPTPPPPRPRQIPPKTETFGPFSLSGRRLTFTDPDGFTSTWDTAHHRLAVTVEGTGLWSRLLGRRPRTFLCLDDHRLPIPEAFSEAATRELLTAVVAAARWAPAYHLSQEVGDE